MPASVTVVIPAYNARAYIGEAIESVLRQTVSVEAIIVVDDGSSDGTFEHVQEQYRDQVTLYRQQNAGATAARNVGIREATTEFVQFLDADDRLHPTKMERTLQAFDAGDPDVGLVCTRYRYVDASGQPMAQRPTIEPPAGHIFCELLRSNGTAILLSTCMVRRSVLVEVGMFRELGPNYATAEDWDLFLRIAARYRIAAVREILVDYRWHGENISRDPLRNAQGRLRTAQFARETNRQAGCMSLAEFDAFLAGRHHALAMLYWRHDRRREARQQFGIARSLTAQSRHARGVLQILTWILPAQAVDRLLAWR